MTKAKKKVITKDSFMVKNLNEEATKLNLLYDGKDSEFYFMVKGIEAKSVQRARVTSQFEIADISENKKTIEDRIDAELYKREHQAKAQAKLAKALITESNLPDGLTIDKAMEQDDSMALAVITHSVSEKNYLVK